jgi:hypothetical protein
MSVPIVFEKLGGSIESGYQYVAYRYAKDVLYSEYRLWYRAVWYQFNSNRERHRRLRYKFYTNLPLKLPT